MFACDGECDWHPIASAGSPRTGRKVLLSAQGERVDLHTRLASATTRGDWPPVPACVGCAPVAQGIRQRYPAWMDLDGRQTSLSQTVCSLLGAHPALPVLQSRPGGYVDGSLLCGQ